MPESILHINESDRIIDRKVVTESNVLFVFTPDCPEHVVRDLFLRSNSSGINWFFAHKRSSEYKSRREIYFLSNGSVLKRKKVVGSKGRDHAHRTGSLIHEIKMSYLLQNIVDEEYTDGYIQLGDHSKTVQYSVQKPWGAVLDLNNKDNRYGLFERVDGICPRDEVQSNEILGSDGWNNTPENERKLYGQMHMDLTRLAQKCMQRGLSPQDLGVHQLIFQDKGDSFKVWILDTEEYFLEIPKKEDCFLPPVLPFM